MYSKLFEEMPSTHSYTIFSVDYVMLLVVVVVDFVRNIYAKIDEMKTMKYNSLRFMYVYYI